ncbi:hypothetical protein P1X14_00985 [Sphingomonas sp. AOB5]|uniref:hypothetical protein n=1 Tax=Sphingomonas sp. AOB5 TaxID=3034017 RepID=UPI0023F78876|nr:hypothetical protein [Sphingomonas sp. AOB5]MDF7773807.1 hypothetical protein [Sphingomonas sp. AOB5]
MIRMLAAMLFPVLAPLQDSAALTRVLACQLPVTEAIELARKVPVHRSRDDSESGAIETTNFYSGAGVTVLGMPVRSAASSIFIEDRMTEIAFAARLDGTFADMSALLLRHYRASQCLSTQSPRGAPVCLLHLRSETLEDTLLDVDVQISEVGGRVQFECLYGTNGH